LVQGVGFGAPTRNGFALSLKKWRCCCYSFSAASSLLSFFKTAVLASKRDLAGDEKYAKNTQLPLLRQDTTTRSLEGQPKKEEQMPKLRQPKKLERRHEKDAARKRSTLLLQRLRHSLYRALAAHLFFFFFFKEASN